MICDTFKDTFLSIKNHYEQYTKADVANILDFKNAYKCSICNACTESNFQMIEHYKIIHQM